MKRRFEIALAEPKDNRELCRLFQIPFDGKISLSMEREPDYFWGARVQYEEPETYVCREGPDTAIAACFSVGKRHVFVNGRKTLLRYHSDLRIDPGYQKTSLLFDICAYFKKRVPLLEGFSQTVVFSDNHIMKGLIDFGEHSRLKSVVPFYIPHGKYISHMISVKPGRFRESGNLVRPACDEDLPAMQKFFDDQAPCKQFYPCYDFLKMSSEYYRGLTCGNFFLGFEDDQLVAIAGVWDQSYFKQTRVKQYAGSLKALRPVVNALGALTGGFLLPEEGASLRYLVLHTILVKDNSYERFRQIWEAMYQYAWKNNYRYILCGLDENDPLNEVFKGYPGWKTKGTHYLVSYDWECCRKLDKRLFYLEAARI